MNEKKHGNRKRSLVLAIAVVMLAASIACGTVADAAEKAVYDATPTCTNEWSNEVTLTAYTEPFYVKDDDNVEKVSLAGLTPLYAWADNPTVCHIAREQFGNSYSLTDCYEADSYGVIAGEEGLFLSK